MFSFLKKCIQIEEPKSVRERAIRTFSGIEGLDDIKEMLLRALESPERAHTLLIGPPACAKSLFMLELEKLMRSGLLCRRSINHQSGDTKIHRGKSA